MGQRVVVLGEGSGATSVSEFADVIALGQGLFYLLTGIWPLVSMHTFTKVTGPKSELWLVKTVGLLVGIVGLVLMMAGARRKVTLETGVLAAGSAASLAAVDLVYVSQRRIRPIYLLDAVVELLLILGWLVAFIPGKAGGRSGGNGGSLSL